MGNDLRGKRVVVLAEAFREDLVELPGFGGPDLTQAVFRQSQPMLGRLERGRTYQVGGKEQPYAVIRTGAQTDIPRIFFLVMAEERLTPNVRASCGEVCPSAADLNAASGMRKAEANQFASHSARC